MFRWHLSALVAGVAVATCVYNIATIKVSGLARLSSGLQ
jgi:hypothetical protein